MSHAVQPAAADPRPATGWGRLHQALMPDYNGPATVYWWTLVLVGAGVLALSVLMVADLTATAWMQITIGTALAMLAGFFPVRIAQSRNSFAAGEIFIFLLLLMHGPSAAVLAATAEAAVGAYRTTSRWTSRIISPAIAALSMFMAGSLLQRLLDVLEQVGLDYPGLLIIACIVCALPYFACVALLISAVGRLKRREPLQRADLTHVFGPVGLAYAASSTVAALLFLTFKTSGISVLMAVLPVLATMIATLHYFFRQQEAAEAVRQSAAEAAAREAELAARHVLALEASERRFHNAFTHASIGMALLSFQGRILQANPALAELLGQDNRALVGAEFHDWVLDEDLLVLSEQMGLISGEQADAFAIELRCRHAAGGTVWVAAHCSFFSEPGATSPSLILQVQDITARRQAEEGLHHIAFHDSLTGLPNRRRFHELLGQAVAAAQADARRCFAVMFLDFDRFKLINDSLGHSAGDDFLVQVARRIQDCIRPGDVVARLGGDEFAILARDIGHEQIAAALADRLLDALRRPFQVAGTELSTSASIGITFSAFGYTTPEEVLRDADTAMYKAKAAGKARYALFDSGLHTEVANRLRLEGDLRRAIDTGQLSVAYQPLYDLHSGRLSGFEALARWTHPQDGPISPLSFIPIAEESGLMVRISDFVLQRACQQLRQWQQLDPRHAELTMNINLSGNDIVHSAFVARVMRAIVEARLQPQHLTLELTENILAARLDAALPALAELRRLGVHLSVDDFGTGYSSLSHLSNLPIDSLKIDRSFVRNLAQGSKEAAVVRAIVLLGQSLGKAVIAEGIETDLQLEQLRDMGCHQGQGFLMARPLDAEAATALLQAAHTPVPAPHQAPLFTDTRPALLH